MNRKQLLFESVNDFIEKMTSFDIKVANQLEMTDLKVKQLFYLKIIDDNESLTHSQLAEILQISKPSVTEIVNKLVSSNCIIKERSPEDGRVYNLKLTEKGKKIARIKKIGMKQFVDNITKILKDNEIDTLVKLFDKIISEHN